MGKYVYADKALHYVIDESDHEYVSEYRKYVPGYGVMGGYAFWSKGIYRTVGTFRNLRKK